MRRFFKIASSLNLKRCKSKGGKSEEGEWGAIIVMISHSDFARSKFQNAFVSMVRQNKAFENSNDNLEIAEIMWNTKTFNVLAMEGASNYVSQWLMFTV